MGQIQCRAPLYCSLYKYSWAVYAIKIVGLATYLVDYFLTLTSFTF